VRAFSGCARTADIPAGYADAPVSLAGKFRTTASAAMAQKGAVTEVAGQMVPCVSVPAVLMQIDSCRGDKRYSLGAAHSCSLLFA
jgi:hypothetical protein